MMFMFDKWAPSLHLSRVYCFYVNIIITLNECSVFRPKKV